MAISISSIGGKKLMIGSGAKKRRPDTKSAIKMIAGVALRCYVCREDLEDDGSQEIDLNIRKIGKRYKKVFFHINCEKDKSES
jgi:hypothetical protein